MVTLDFKFSCSSFIYVLKGLVREKRECKIIIKENWTKSGVKTNTNRCYDLTSFICFNVSTYRYAGRNANQTVDCTQSLIHTYCLSCRSQQASIDRSLFGPPAVRHLHVYVVQGYRASSTTSSLLRKPEELSDLLYFSFKPDNNRVTDEAIRAMQDYT